MAKNNNTDQIIDALATEFFTLDREKNEAMWQSKATELFSIVLKAYGKGKEEALGAFWLSDQNKYNPEKGSYSGFIKNRLKLRSRDVHAENLGTHIVNKEAVSDSSLNEIVGESESGTKQDNLADEVTVDEDLIADSTAVECIALALNLSTELQGRSNNPTRINYFRMFFTDGVVNTVRREERKVFFQHERDLFCAMRIPFLDYFMENKCRDILSILQSRLKCCCEVIEKNADKAELTQPLPKAVYISYLKRVEGKNVGDSAISEQHKAYVEFMRNKLC